MTKKVLIDYLDLVCDLNSNMTYCSNKDNTIFDVWFYDVKYEICVFFDENRNLYLEIVFSNGVSSYIELAYCLSDLERILNYARK